MIHRRKLAAVREALARQAAVALIGPRQVGKTTLALELAEGVPSLYLAGAIERAGSSSSVPPR